jgi:hypothetical protein
MLERIAIMILLMAGMVACQDKGPRDDVAEIRAAYAEYRSALQEGDGEKAATLSDANTAAYYEKMLELARHADSTQVARLDVMDRITVLGLRMQADEDLAEMDARDAIALGAASGMMGGDEMGALELGTITVDGDKATAPIRMYGLPVPAKFHFQREGGDWKVDMTPLFTILRMTFDQMALRSGMPTNDWLMDMLEASTGERPGNAIWHPK